MGGKGRGEERRGERKRNARRKGGRGGGLIFDSRCFEIFFYQHVSTTTHHCENGSWFLDPQCIHHLEHVHHSLSLAALDGGGNGTEHTRAANSITVQGEKIEKEVQCCDSSTQTVQSTLLSVNSDASIGLYNYIAIEFFLLSGDISFSFLIAGMFKSYLYLQAEMRTRAAR